MSNIKFEIEFDKEDCIYEAGEEINGRVLMCLENPQSARGLKIKVEGKCFVQWVRKKLVQNPSGSMRTETSILTGSEHYIDRTEYLIGHKNGRKMKFPAGEQSYPFSFQLPKEIPSSFQHKFGIVIYTLKAVIDRVNESDTEITKIFTVVSKLDLNTIPGAARGIHDEDNVSLCEIWCCLTGGMDVQVRLPVRGYVPGQNIEAKVCFDNRSEVEIEEIKLNFAQMITFKVPTDDEIKIEKNILENKTLYGPFYENGAFNVSILVGSVPASFFRYCRLIDIDYVLNVTYVTSGWHFNISKDYPIIIGTVPLTSSLSEYVTASVPVEATEPSAPYLLGPEVPVTPYPLGPEVPVAPYPTGPEVSVAPYPLGPEVPVAPYPPGPEVPVAPYPPGPEVSVAPYLLGPKVPVAPYPPGPEVRVAPYPPEPADRPTPINYQPMHQNHKLGFDNYKPRAGEPVNGIPFVPVPGPSTLPIGFVVPPEFPPPSYEECTRESNPVDQEEEPNSGADVKQPVIPPYPLDNLPYKDN